MSQEPLLVDAKDKDFLGNKKEDLIKVKVKDKEENEDEDENEDQGGNGDSNGSSAKSDNSTGKRTLGDDSSLLSPQFEGKIIFSDEATKEFIEKLIKNHLNTVVKIPSDLSKVEDLDKKITSGLLGTREGNCFLQMKEKPEAVVSFLKNSLSELAQAKTTREKRMLLTSVQNEILKLGEHLNFLIAINKLNNNMNPEGFVAKFFGKIGKHPYWNVNERTLQTLYSLSVFQGSEQFSNGFKASTTERRYKIIQDHLLKAKEEEKVISHGRKTGTYCAAGSGFLSISGIVLKIGGNIPVIGSIMSGFNVFLVITQLTSLILTANNKDPKNNSKNTAKSVGLGIFVAIGFIMLEIFIPGGTSWILGDLNITTLLITGTSIAAKVAFEPLVASRAESVKTATKILDKSVKGYENELKQANDMALCNTDALKVENTYCNIYDMENSLEQESKLESRNLEEIQPRISAAPNITQQNLSKDPNHEHMRE